MASLSDFDESKNYLHPHRGKKPDYKALNRWQHSRKINQPDFEALQSWQDSLQDETYTERQARMAKVGIEDPDYDIKSGDFSISKIRSFFSKKK